MKVKDMGYYELLAEKQRLQNAIKSTSSVFLKRDYTKCLNKIDCKLWRFENDR